MPNQEEIEKMAEELRFIKSAIMKSGNIVRWVAWAGAIRWIALAGGLLIIAAAIFAEMLKARYGGFAETPALIKVVFFGAIAVFVVLFAVWKLRKITGQLRKTGNEVTILRLFKDAYAGQLIFFVPFLLTVAGLIVFLAERGLGYYIVPSLAILLGLSFVFFAMYFRFRELYGCCFWQIATGFACLFMDRFFSPMGALALTFGGSMVILFVMTLFPWGVNRAGGSRG